jgi:hypothetical protein
MSVTTGRGANGSPVVSMEEEEEEDARIIRKKSGLM